MRAKTVIPPESENQFQAAVLELARCLGYLAYHTHDSRRSQAGFPDLILVRNGRILAAELKSDKGRVSPAQQVWLQELSKAGIPCYVWRPRMPRQELVDLLS